MPRRLWTRDEMILTLALYFQLPFGRLNHTTAEVKELAKLMNRTENAVALRLVNFAACDPYITESGAQECLRACLFANPSGMSLQETKKNCFWKPNA